jgi:hypothetical protein
VAGAPPHREVTAERVAKSMDALANAGAPRRSSHQALHFALGQRLAVR